MKDLLLKLLTEHYALASTIASLLLVGLAVNLANALLKYPETEKLGRSILDRLSILSNSDSPGTLKKLGKRSANPKKLSS